MKAAPAEVREHLNRGLTTDQHNLEGAEVIMTTPELVTINAAAVALKTQHGRIRTFCRAQGVSFVEATNPKNGRTRHLLPASVLEQWLTDGPVCCETECAERVCRTDAGHLTSRCQRHHDRRHAPVGARHVTREGYVMVKTGESAGRYGYVWLAEHRMLMAAHLGRPLESCENVHHVNGDRADNRIENLELWFKPQTAGQRVEDLIAYVATHHRDAVLAAVKEGNRG